VESDRPTQPRMSLRASVGSTEASCPGRHRDSPRRPTVSEHRFRESPRRAPGDSFATPGPSTSTARRSIPGKDSGAIVTFDGGSGMGVRPGAWRSCGRPTSPRELNW
jgi:hypothetical protein